MNKNIFHNLNNEQYLAVTYPLKSVLILAGAGSGKTHVLINRIVWLIKYKKILFSQILAVTFTNKAANEIILRLSKIFLNVLNINNNIWVGTFHSICYKLLRIHYKEVNLPYYFRIIDFNDQLTLVNSLIKELKLDKNIYSKKKIVYIFNKFKNKGIRYINLKNSIYDANIILLYKLYEKQCKLNGVVDFSELLLCVYEFFLKKKKFLKKYQKIFKYIFIDEFQDTNLLQYKLIKLLSNKKNIIFAVGDDDQNIFSFRGSNINNMFLFKKDFNILKIIKLEQNYRSNKYILNAANYLISNNKNRLGKKLFTNLNLGKKIIIFKFDNEFQEAQWVTKKIKKIYKKNKIINSNIAILYRSNFQSRLLEYNFFLEKIPYKIYGKYSFLEKKEIKKAIFYLKLINNVHDNLSFLEVVNFPPRGIGLKTLKKLKFLSEKYNCSLYLAVFYIKNKKKKSLLTLINFIKLINMISNKIKQLSFKESIIFILESSGIIYFYKNFKKKIFSLDNLNQLINLVNYFLFNYFNFFIKNKKNTINIILSNFLSYILMENEDYFNKKKKNKIQLMTIHSSKGLEFDIIFIIGLEEGIFPPYKGNYKNNFLEEERRLMYVAITRAKKKLYISFANCRIFLGNKIYNKKSRFINELPNFLINKYY